eukprot:m51a1_g12084 putative histone-lysine n-methyltransferase setd2 (496) ;mRNA; f:21-1803
MRFTICAGAEDAADAGRRRSRARARRGGADAASSDTDAGGGSGSGSPSDSAPDVDSDTSDAPPRAQPLSPSPPPPQTTPAAQERAEAPASASACAVGTPKSRTERKKLEKPRKIVKAPPSGQSTPVPGSPAVPASAPTPQPLAQAQQLAQQLAQQQQLAPAVSPTRARRIIVIRKKRRARKRDLEGVVRKTSASLWAYLPPDLRDFDLRRGWDFEYIQDSVSMVQRKITPGCEACQCKYVEGSPACCTGMCINYNTKTECTFGRCPAGQACRNTRMQRHQNAPLGQFLSKKKGWGIFTLIDLYKGQFVIEYVGEIISQAMCEERLKARQMMGSRGIADHSYMMTLNNDEFIDAREKGNLSRFINHSCNPNCETQKWLIRGEDHMGIFAKHFIPAGTELTFDYKFQRFDAEKQPCYCGEPNCSGWLGVQKKMRKRRPAAGAGPELAPASQDEGTGTSSGSSDSSDSDSGSGSSGSSSEGSSSDSSSSSSDRSSKAN